MPAIFSALVALVMVWSGPLLAQSPVAPGAEDPRLEAAEKLIREYNSPEKWLRLKAELAEIRAKQDLAHAATTRAYKEAAKVRQESEIIDPDPESPDVAVSSLDGSNTEEYLRLKTAYLAAKAAYEKLEPGFVCRITTVDTARKTASGAAKARDRARAKVTEFLRSGKVTDPDPEDLKSAVSSDSGDKAAAAEYLEHKAHYLACKRRAAEATIGLGAAIAEANKARDAAESGRSTPR